VPCGRRRWPRRRDRGSVEEIERGREDGASGLEIVGGVLELVGDPLLAFADGLEPSFDLLLRQIRVADEVEPSILLRVEFGELVAQRFAETRGCLAGIGGDGGGDGCERLSMAFGNADERVVVNDGRARLSRRAVREGRSHVPGLCGR
jgi:hypothetical protein